MKNVVRFLVTSDKVCAIDEVWLETQTMLSLGGDQKEAPDSLDDIRYHR